ncbi:Protein of unknown function (DUF3298) [Abditibacterium utsteinense]|uniref:DUF3298 domain-containing protein n=1 Tax=Abditibacterium utsteinense TaxID=1960156 RepID=A0A2S8SVW8_9BACT|nr:RsiV family protein [Abditibacterium utsteinense]PQV64934.1 Protein of unknown function (DUF3298) [Abditibacterium utsteinense]
MKIRFMPLLFCCLFVLTGISMAPALAQKSLSGQKLTALKKVARFETLSEKGKNYTATATFPVFRARTPLARYANAQLRARAVRSFRAWLKDTGSQVKGLPDPPAPYDFEIAPSPSFFVARRLISTRLDSYEYNGGAHGMSVMSPLNFGLVKGQLKLLVLGDFFRSNSPYRTLVETKILAKLRKNPDAMWVSDGTVKHLETLQFNNFSVERDGLRWLFNPYEMGPYVAGLFEVKLSLRELGPNFHREWLR